MPHHSWPLLPSFFTQWGLGYQPGWRAHPVSPRWVGGNVQEMHVAVIPLSPLLRPPLCLAHMGTQ